ncbi:MAG: TetR family transcriptional regulator [Candidatus Acidiferrales bacterium]
MTNGIPTQTISKQQARSETTRRKLLEAAEKVFVRDGFEAARLEDIAASAGYTRGAFYANFEDKADCFFQLLELWVGERIAEVHALIEQHGSAAARRRALREHYARQACDRRLTLLALEFKLFAVRHPQSLARLRVRMERMRTSAMEAVGRIAKGRSRRVSNAAAITALGAFSKGLFLEHLVDPKALRANDMRELAGIVFDALIGE